VISPLSVPLRYCSPSSRWDDEVVRALVRRALSDGRGLAGAVTLAPDAEDHLVRLAAGDVRKSLTALEAAAASAQSQGVTKI